MVLGKIPGAYNVAFVFIGVDLIFENMDLFSIVFYYQKRLFDKFIEPYFILV
jgi:hypothetical protein